MYKKLVQLNDNEKGGTLIVMTVFSLFSMMVIVMISSTIVNNGIKIGATQVNSTKAYYAAEAGGEKLLWDMRREDGVVDSGDKFVDNNNHVVCYDSDNPDSSLITESVLNTCSGPGEEKQYFDLALKYGYKTKYFFDDTDASIELIIQGFYGDIQRSVKLYW